MKERFRDPTGALASYVFDINHDEEQGFNFDRSVEKTATTTGPEFVMQQGLAAQRGTLNYSGKILNASQYAAMLTYFQACETRTVFFREFTGVEYEVLITRFNPKRVRTMANQRDPTMPFNYYTYDIEMEIVS